MTNTSTEADLGDEIVRFARVLHRIKASMAGLLPAGLDPAAAQLLAWLVRQGPSRQGELADWTLLDPSTVSRRVGQLVTHGLAERRAVPGDGRAVRLYPTQAGIDLFGELRAHRQELLRRVFTDWPEADITQLRLLMGRFNDDIEALSTPAAPVHEESHDHR